MAIQEKRLLTYADYAALAEDGKRYELIDGVMHVVAAPTRWHQILVETILAHFWNYLQVHPVGEVYIAPFDVILNPPVSTRAWQPDIVYISKERSSIITDANIQGAPDLVVEVLSPGSEERDLGPKKQAYQESGVQEYWVVWQSLPRVEVFRLQPDGKYGDPRLLEAGDVLTTELLVGFSLGVDRLYAGLGAGTPAGHEQP